MAKPNEKLASSLTVLKELQDNIGNVIKTTELSRTHRERLMRTGFLTSIMSGWWVVTRPEDRPGDSTYWYASFWEFCRRFCTDKFDDAWCLSPEHSLLVHAESPTIPKQVIIWSANASGHNRALPYETGIYDLSKAIPEQENLTEKDGLPVFTIEVALTQVRESFFRNNWVEAQIVLSSLKSTTPLLAKLLDGGHVKAAGRLAGALRRLDRGDEADKIVKRMRSLDHDVRETDPFDEGITVPNLQTGIAPLVARVRNAWEDQRQVVVDLFPSDRPLPNNADVYLAALDEIYVNDAYNSLSIEGYRVSEELIERVSSGAYDPLNNETDKRNKDTLAASGYYLAFQSVRSSIANVLKGEGGVAVALRDYDDWYASLFQPSVDAGLIRAGALAGFRNHPVFLRGSRHTPPRVEAIADGMEELFSLMSEEKNASVRAVLSHWLLGYIHPYPDGNGRMARFMMNVMFASGGHPWAIIRMEDRTRYMAALEVASMEFQIRPFAELLLERLDRSETELNRKV